MRRKGPIRILVTCYWVWPLLLASPTGKILPPPTAGEGAFARLPSKQKHLVIVDFGLFLNSYNSTLHHLHHYGFLFGDRCAASQCYFGSKTTQARYIYLSRSSRNGFVLFAWLTFSSGGRAQSGRDQAWFLPPPPQHRRIRSPSHKYPTVRSFMLQELHQIQLGGRL